MRGRAVAVVLLVAGLAGCGGTTTKTGTKQKLVPPFVCHPKYPAQAGECVRQELEHRGIKPSASAPFATARRYQGIDISRWQPHPEFRRLYKQGIRFVIVQGADNDFQSNPYFDYQVRHAHEAHMKVGVYIFAEGAASSSQARALVNAASGERMRITLGAWVDAEVPSAYGHACGIARELSHSFHIVGVYGSPGTYGGGRCRGYVWPAEWGGGAAYPLSGYPFSAIKVRQWCGTCYLAGNSGQIDRDENLGLMALPSQ